MEAPGGGEWAGAAAADLQGSAGLHPLGCAVFPSEQGLMFQVKTEVGRLAGNPDRLGLTG